MDNRNATSSWSGYVYQGRVGLLVALRKLSFLIAEKSCDEIKEYSLIFENAEDFDIQRSNKVVSRHQVKCYKNATTMTHYKKVLNVQKRTFLNGHWTLDEEGFQINEFKSNGECIKNVVDEDNRFLHVINDVPGFGLSEDEFSQWKNQEAGRGNVKYVSNPNEIRLYEYEPNKRYCQLQADNEDNDLKTYCELEIAKIIKLKNPELLSEPDIIDVRYNQLLDILDQKIYRCHINKNGTVYPIFTFQEIVNAILNDHSIEIGVLGIFRKLISKYWDDYRAECFSGLRDISNQIDESDFERVEEILKEIVSFDEEELKQFIYQIQTTKKSLDVVLTSADLNSLCTESQMQQIFFQLLLEVRKSDFSLQNTTYNKDGGYAVSIINKDATEIKVTVKNIIENRVLLQNIYEKDYLINKSINDILVLDYFRNDNVKKATKNWGENVDIVQKMDIRGANLQFISVEDAIKKLNGENND
ncbi:ABC-three component system protein [Latilactobacillus sp. 5-91]|uniref:ABC-three component system protein n=1 Tax=Latilactobacillus sp. 5-91 TaxID=3410924 RepID=UPI003C766520